MQDVVPGAASSANVEASTNGVYHVSKKYVRNLNMLASLCILLFCLIKLIANLVVFVRGLWAVQ